jgi:hypothetical protein
MMKNLLNPERLARFFEALNSTRTKVGRLGSSIYGDRASDAVQLPSTFSRSTEKESLVAGSLQSERKVFFFHVMKTGGVTFRRILASIYGTGFKVCYDPAAEAIEASLSDTQAIEFHSFHFKGQLAHMHSGLTSNDRWDILEGQDCFTMLREPVDQVVSLYYHLLRRRILIEPVYIARGLRFPETFEQFLDEICHFNVQTAFLADRHQLDPSTAATRADLERAKTTLTRLKMHVGLTERFGDSMNIFEHVTGRQIPGGVIHSENRNPDRIPVEDISPKLRDRIREQSALDVELYEFGREMFLEDFSRCGQRRSYTFQNTPRADQAVVVASSSGLNSSGVKAGAASTSIGQSSTSIGQSTEARKAVFFHVMKTGGMTFRRILSSIYGDKFHIIENPEIESVADALKNFDCIEFHTLPFQGDFFHMHANLAKQRRWDLLAGTDVFTMFREPVDQVVSQYYYLHHKRAFIEPAYKVNGMKFPETMEEYLDNPLHLNNQLAFLVGKYRMKPGDELTSADLVDAKEMLIQLNVHAGLTERFSESLHVFETIAGRRVPGGQILNQNQNPDRLPLEAISARTKDRIRELSALDNALYSFARDIFMKDVAQCGKTRQYTFIDTAKRALATPGKQ